MCRPATHDEIKSIIGSRFATFPQPQRDEGEAAAFFADYFDALDGLSASMIEAGMAAHVKDPDAEFLPKPGRLAHLARTEPATGRWSRAHSRARLAVERSRALPSPMAAPASRPSKQEMSAMMADFHSRMAAKAPVVRTAPRRPTPSARVDGRGISDDARRNLRERFGYRDVAAPHDDQPHTTDAR